MREFADELGPVIKKVRAGNTGAITTLTSLKGIADIASASNAIAKKGYKIGG